MIKNFSNEILKLSLQNKPVFDKGEHEKYVYDWRGQYHGETIAILKPNDTNEVSSILNFANKHKLAVVPQGGNTGLCGGATPINGQESIVLSTEKINKIRSIDKNTKSLTVESGVILSDIHDYVEKSDLFFPLNLGAKGSCMIGGNLSTNAGGINVLKYGNTRELCLGLEVVLPDGNILDLLSDLKKDNTGYDLKNIFIGAEGTLGIITAATLKLFPLPKIKLTSFAEAKTISNAINLLNIFQHEIPNGIEAFELMPKTFWEVASNNIDNIIMPLDEMPEMGVLIEISSNSEEDAKINSNGSTILNDKLEKILAYSFEKEIITNATICKNNIESQQLWNIRERAAESEKKELEKTGAIKCLKHDISLPLNNIERFHNEAQLMLNNIAPNSRTIYFGHLGDGNLHYNIFGDGNLPDGFNKRSIEITEKLYEIVLKYKGSFSAEHGIGQLRKKSLKIHKNSVAYDLMKNIKNQLDPKNIMNPGKIFI